MGFRLELVDVEIHGLDAYRRSRKIVERDRYRDEARLIGRGIEREIQLCGSIGGKSEGAVVRNYRSGRHGHGIRNLRSRRIRIVDGKRRGLRRIAGDGDGREGGRNRNDRRRLGGISNRRRDADSFV